MIQGLLFDLDGVLVNTNPLHCQASGAVAKRPPKADVTILDFCGVTPDALLAQLR